MSLNIVNLTPHTLNFYEGDKLLFSVDSAGTIRVSEIKEYVGEVEGIKITYKRYSDIEPHQIEVIKRYMEDDSVDFIVVSTIVYQKLREKGLTEKVYVPDEMVRGPDGRVVGCRALAKIE